MVAIPKKVLDLLADKGTTKVLVTSNKEGRPHAIVAGSILSPAPDTMIVGEVLMKVSANNLKENKKAAFLIVKGLESYEINVRAKARVDSGADLDNMNKALAGMHLHANAIWVFEVCCVSDESAGPTSGKKLT